MEDHFTAKLSPFNHFAAYLIHPELIFRARADNDANAIVNVLALFDD